MSGYRHAPRVKFTPELWRKWAERALVTPSVERRRRDIAEFRKSFQTPADVK